MSFRTGLSEASIACVFWRAPCSLDIRREAESDPVSYVWTLDFGEGAFVVRQARIPFISCSEITKPCTVISDHINVRFVMKGCLELG